MLSPDSPDGRRLVLLLGLAQTISWGTLYFAFTVFLAPMHDTLGWTRPFLAGGFSLGLLVWALCSFLVGRTLERWPARRVMGTGSVLAAASLLAWSRVGGETAFLLLWLPMGVAMATTLYDPAFVVLRQAFGDAYQRPIVGLTLIAGFASTIGIPLAQWGVAHVGWRHTCRRSRCCICSSACRSTHGCGSARRPRSWPGPLRLRRRRSRRRRGAWPCACRCSGRWCWPSSPSA